MFVFSLSLLYLDAQFPPCQATCEVWLHKNFKQLFCQKFDSCYHLDTVVTKVFVSQKWTTTS